MAGIQARLTSSPAIERCGGIDREGGSHGSSSRRASVQLARIPSMPQPAAAFFSAGWPESRMMP